MGGSAGLNDCGVWRKRESLTKSPTPAAGRSHVPRKAGRAWSHCPESIAHRKLKWQVVESGVTFVRAEFR